jgi:hypothetical protein
MQNNNKKEPFAITIKKEEGFSDAADIDSPRTYIDRHFQG